MPKLNVQQNNQNVIQAFKNALAIGNLKGIIASDGSHNFSTAGSNRNLLDNPWFTVNQRSAATIPVGGYGVDRWKGGSAGAVTVVSGGLQFIGRGNAYQIPPSGFWDSMMGKTVTASLLFSDGTVQGGSGVIGSGVTEFGTYNGVRIFKSASNNFNLESNSDANCIVRAVKLELGSVSTLPNDAPPDYGEELAKCQYYFRRWSSPSGSSAIGLALAVGATNANFALLSSLRASGSATISFSGLVLSDGTDHAVTNVTVAGAGDGATMRLLLTSTGLTAYRAYTCQISAGGHLDVSKDL